MTGRKMITIGFVGLAGILALGAVAWACTPSAYLYPVSPSSGAAGTEVIVRGGQFGNGPVELRWASENGRLLATTLGPDFSAKATIPDKGEGVYYLVAVARDPADNSRILARRSEAFQITTDGRSPDQTAAALWSEESRPLAEANRFPTAAIAGLALGAGAGAMALLAVVVLRRRQTGSL